MAADPVYSDEQGVDQADAVTPEREYPKPRSSTAAYMSSDPDSYSPLSGRPSIDQETNAPNSEADQADGASKSADSGSGTATDPRSNSLSEFDGSEPVIKLSEVVCVINQFPALAGVTLSINEGEVVLVRGPNGAGKSTLLRLCAGLAPLASGTGQVLGHDLSNTKSRRALRRESGLLAHETYLYDQLTVEENIHFWAKANRVDIATVEPVLDRLDLGGRLRDVAVGALSAGQRRRASIALMISRRPRLWLLDEPHAGLDQVGRQLMDELVGHAVAFGATVLLASHDLDRATELATTSVSVVGGRIEETQHHAP